MGFLVFRWLNGFFKTLYHSMGFRAGKRKQIKLMPGIISGKIGEGTV